MTYWDFEKSISMFLLTPEYRCLSTILSKLHSKVQCSNLNRSDLAKGYFVSCYTRDLRGRRNEREDESEQETMQTAAMLYTRLVRTQTLTKPHMLILQLPSTFYRPFFVRVRRFSLFATATCI